MRRSPARTEDRKASRHRLRFEDSEPDLVWWVTPQGFRLAPAGVDVAAIQTGAGVTIPATAAADEVSAATVRAIERAYRVERLRRMAAHDAAGADEPRVELKHQSRAPMSPARPTARPAAARRATPPTGRAHSPARRSWCA